LDAPAAHILASVREFSLICSISALDTRTRCFWALCPTPSQSLRTNYGGLLHFCSPRELSGEFAILPTVSCRSDGLFLLCCCHALHVGSLLIALWKGLLPLLAQPSTLYSTWFRAWQRKNFRRSELVNAMTWTIPREGHARSAELRFLSSCNYFRACCGSIPVFHQPSAVCALAGLLVAQWQADACANVRRQLQGSAVLCCVREVP